MGALEVDTIGLRMLAAHCQSWAAEVEPVSPQETLGLSWQATSAAVSAVHANVSTAGRVLASRMESSAARLVAAAVDYYGADDHSAAQIHNLATAL